MSGLPECDCGIPLLEGAGQHAPGCAVFCKVMIPGVGRCELDADGHEVHTRGAVTWNPKPLTKRRATDPSTVMP